MKQRCIKTFFGPMPMEHSKDFFYSLISCFLSSWEHFETQQLCLLGIQNQLCEEMMLIPLISALILSQNHWKEVRETYVILTFWDNKDSNIVLWAPNSASFCLSDCGSYKAVPEGTNKPSHCMSMLMAQEKCYLVLNELYILNIGRYIKGLQWGQAQSVF